MGRLVSSAQPYQRHELPDPRRPGTPRRTWTEVVKPGGPFTYDKPMAVLVGRWTGSMGEGVAIALDGMQRADVLGSAMAGLRGAIETLDGARRKRDQGTRRRRVRRGIPLHDSNASYREVGCSQRVDDV